jgi:antitoxin HicB
MQKTENAHRGSTLDSFLHEEGIYHQVTTAAVLEVFVEEAREEMERQKRSQSWLARKMGTSRAVLSRLFQPKPAGVTVSTLVRFADALDKDIRIELIDRPAKKRQEESRSVLERESQSRSGR